MIAEVLRKIRAGEKVTQKDHLAAYIQAKESVELGEVVVGESREYLMELLLFYIPNPRSEPTDIRIEAESGWGLNSRRTVVIFKDGTEKLMSLRKAAMGKTQEEQRTSKETYLSTFRREVKDQIVHFKLRALSRPRVFCEVTGVTTTQEDVDVDHYQHPFSRAVEIFLKEEGLSFGEISLRSDYLDGGKFLSDRDLATRWQLFHTENCRLRIVSKKAHRKMTGMAKSMTEQQIDEWVDEQRQLGGLPRVGPPEDPCVEDEPWGD